jgi:hypothetical protein
MSINPDNIGNLPQPNSSSSWDPSQMGAPEDASMPERIKHMTAEVLVVFKLYWDSRAEVAKSIHESFQEMLRVDYLLLEKMTDYLKELNRKSAQSRAHDFNDIINPLNQLISYLKEARGTLDDLMALQKEEPKDPSLHLEQTSVLVSKLLFYERACQAIVEGRDLPTTSQQELRTLILKKSIQRPDE